jgi:hypothetical protein
MGSRTRRPPRCQAQSDATPQPRPSRRAEINRRSATAATLPRAVRQNALRFVEGNLDLALSEDARPRNSCDRGRGRRRRRSATLATSDGIPAVVPMEAPLPFGPVNRGPANLDTVRDRLKRAQILLAAGAGIGDGTFFTATQGQYLAFIHAYTLVNGRPPAQADIQRFFQVTPPSVHRMLLTLERERLISRRPGMPRSIVVLVDRADLPALEPGYGRPVKITVQRSSLVRRQTRKVGSVH